VARKLTTYLDLVDAIAEAIGVQSADTNARNKIKRLINMYYLDEVIPFKRWQWLEKTTSIVHKAYYNTDTVEVTPESTTITLETAPNVGLGSFAGYRFSVDASNKVYTIATHTAGSTTATLTSAYQEALNEEATFRIWRDRIDLPTDAKETIEIWHSEQSTPLNAVGSQGFRKLEASNPKAEGFPVAYNTWDFIDPSTDDGESESDRYRQTRVYPSITATPVTLNVDYIQDVTELDDDADEPLLPIGDRIVLYYGAGAEAWSILSRNEEMADKWRIKALEKLSRMAGEREDGMDTPSVSPKSGYINNIRRGGLRNRTINANAFGGQSSVSIPTYLRDVTIEGATLTDDMVVDDDVLIDGRDISEDGEALDALSALSTATLTDNTSGGTVQAWALATYNTVSIRYCITRDSDRRAGQIMITGLGAVAAIAEGSIAEISDPGVTFTADIAGGNLRLLYTTSNTGSDATMTYQAFAWLG
jgi:hypothetical protein